MPETVQNYVDGKWVDSQTGETFEVINPADTSEVVATFQQSSAEDAERAVEAAAAAEDEWPTPRHPARRDDHSELVVREIRCHHRIRERHR